jgi:hypothetical protein
MTLNQSLLLELDFLTNFLRARRNPEGLFFPIFFKHSPTLCLNGTEKIPNHYQVAAITPCFSFNSIQQHDLEQKPEASKGINIEVWLQEKYETNKKPSISPNNEPNCCSTQHAREEK